MDPEPTYPSSQTLFGGNKICRSCLKSCENPIYLYSNTEFVMDKRLKDCFEDMCNLQISPEDNLPETICDKCNHLLVQSYMFRYQTRKNDDFLKSIVEGNLIQVEDIPNEDLPLSTMEETLIPDDIPPSDDISPILLEDNQPTDAQKKKITCQYCSKEFFHKKNLKSHERRHFDEGGFRCNICDRSFHTKFECTRHINKHIKLRPFQCTKCEKNFMSQPELNRHAKTHLVDKPFECTQCEKKFTYHTNLVSHMTAVHDKTKRFECEFCGKRFVTKSKVKRHQASNACSAAYSSNEEDADDCEEVQTEQIDEQTPAYSINLEGMVVPVDAQSFNEENLFELISNVS